MLMTETKRGVSRASLLWLAYALCGIGVACAATETVVHNFASPPKGAIPYAGVIRDSAGNFFGTTSEGGAFGWGVVYRLNAAGKETVLHSFTGGADGGYPYAGVVRDSAGNLYGTTSQGGAYGAGVVYKLSASGQETVLYSFTGGADGGSPYAGVTLDSSGNLYGTTEFGGASGAGVVYKVSASGQQTVLHSFDANVDGAQPYAGVIRDSSGNLYGTTSYGGASLYGAVYKLSASGQQTVLYNFTGGNDGGGPLGGVIRDSAGNLYGTTVEGGSYPRLAGTVYEVSASGQETVLYHFTGGADGGNPQAGVIRDSAGNLYGTTFYGGATGNGVVFEVSNSGQETVLYSFPGGATGAGLPLSGVIRDAAGNLYGTTELGGAWGVVYQLTPSGQPTVLYGFPGAADGAYPSASLTRDSAGNLYGTAGGGTSGWGVVYRVDSSGRQNVLYTFSGGADGSTPIAGVIRDSAGTLYGTTLFGGASSWGVVYKVSPSGKETVLHTFTGSADGGYPRAGLIHDSAGSLYGTTSTGGAFGNGVVFKLSAAGQETVLYNFTGGLDGGDPIAGVIQDTASNLYGTAPYGGSSGQGVVYKLSAAGQETVLHSFTGTDGANPYGGVIQDSAGNLYGTTYFGGASNYGVVYKVSTAGQQTVLYSFTGGADGGQPYAGVILGANGSFYGTTSAGGASGHGVVYKLSPSGQETVLYSFTGGADGALPYAGLIQDPAGALYGTTGYGGSENAGVIFKLTP